MTVDRTLAAIARALCCPVDFLAPEKRLAADLDVDLADKLEIAHEVSSEFDVCLPAHHAHAFKTVQDVLDWTAAWVPAEVSA